MPYKSDRSIAFLGNYLPRKCGIATFTSDVCNAVAKEVESPSNVFAIAMNDTDEGYLYPEMVKFSIRDQMTSDYEKAADFINSSRVDALCIQHEYGIYGGKWGSYLHVLLRKIKIPVVTVLHTVLEKYEDDLQEKVFEELAARSNRLIVMSERAVDMLVKQGIPKKKITHIPHGSPDFPFKDPYKYKENFDLVGKTMMLTFGLMRRSKGIEYAIEAMGKVVNKYPDLVFVVLGATHPHVVKKYGEEYRHSLMRQVDRLGLQKNVLFHNRFVEAEDLCEYINAADIYALPYLNKRTDYLRNFMLCHGGREGCYLDAFMVL